MNPRDVLDSVKGPASYARRRERKVAYRRQGGLTRKVLRALGL
jgi:hypothetical protein